MPHGWPLQWKISMLPHHVPRGESTQDSARGNRMMLIEIYTLERNM